MTWINIAYGVSVGLNILLVLVVMLQAGILRMQRRDSLDHLKESHFMYTQIILSVCKLAFGAEEVMVYTSDESDDDDDDEGSSNLH
jgi:hypothetical protein